MTIIGLSETIHGWLGWCPNQERIYLPCADRPEGSRIDLSGSPEEPRPGPFAWLPPEPRWMTAAGLAVLFATFFVGGNFWWPLLVLAILVVFTIVYVRSIRHQGVS